MAKRCFHGVSSKYIQKDLDKYFVTFRAASFSSFFFVVVVVHVRRERETDRQTETDRDRQRER